MVGGGGGGGNAKGGMREEMLADAGNERTFTERMCFCYSCAIYLHQRAKGGASEEGGRSVWTDEKSARLCIPESSSNESCNSVI
jgi:hypothetical protein